MRLFCFMGVLTILWLPIAIPIYVLLQQDPNLASIVTMALLFFELLFLWHYWGKVAYQEPHILNRYGLVKSSKNGREYISGLATGLCFCLSLYLVQILLGWVEFINPSSSIIKIVLEGFFSAMGIALAEELLFRGWLLDELRQDYSQKTCFWLGSIIFAMAHFLKPINEIIRTAVTFPALILLGMTLILAKCNNGDRLGICVGIHGGLVWGYYIINVGDLINYTYQVPEWITGIDENPISGIIGLIFLLGLFWLNLKSKNHLQETKQ